MSEPNFQIPCETIDLEKQGQLEIALSDRIYFKQVEPKLAGKVSTKINPGRQERCRKLYDDGLLKVITVEDVFKDTEEKKRALRDIMGYRSLRGVSSLDSARPETIGKVYQRDFYQGEPKHN